MSEMKSPSMRAMKQASEWLDRHFQARGQFAASAKVQRRVPEMMGIVALLARYKTKRGAHEHTNGGEAGQ